MTIETKPRPTIDGFIVPVPEKDLLLLLDMFFLNSCCYTPTKQDFYIPKPLLHLKQEREGGGVNTLSLPPSPKLLYEEQEKKNK
jgi:hypothetical protein